MDTNTDLQIPYDRVSIMHDIDERKQIIERYRMTGYLDREDAIQKIQMLRAKDQYVMVVAEALQAAGRSIPLSQAPDQAIIAELETQVAVLTAKMYGNVR